MYIAVTKPEHCEVDMYTYLSSDVTQWKVANSTLFARVQAPIGLVKGFCTEGKLNKQRH